MMPKGQLLNKRLEIVFNLCLNTTTFGLCFNQLTSPELSQVRPGKFMQDLCSRFLQE